MADRAGSGSAGSVGFNFGVNVGNKELLGFESTKFAGSEGTDPSAARSPSAPPSARSAAKEKAAADPHQCPADRGQHALGEELAVTSAFPSSDPLAADSQGRQ